jgi:glycosyltransferase involved in cell wall biosynthesis
MKIGIDARLYGLKHAGIGRYVKNIVDQITQQDTNNQIVLFVQKDSNISLNLENVKIVTLDVPHYSISEQLIAANAFEKEDLDVLHVPHFNAPILYRGKLIVTIHDLIKHESTGPDTTTRNRAIYWLKFYGYKTLSWLVARKATRIIVPSEYVKNDVVKKLGITPNKIDVVYEAVENDFKKLQPDKKVAYELMNKFGLVKPFMVYTGSVYPHKNLEIILQAIKARNYDRSLDFMLAIVCARNVFYERLNQKITEMDLGNVVKLLGFLSDQDLVSIYDEAFCLVQPSKMEGFGLTGLEAMSRGLPVIAADASCLPEVYKDGALYFDPNSYEDFLYRLDDLVTNKNLYNELQLRGKSLSKSYSWKKNGQQTLKVYAEVYKS